MSLNFTKAPAQVILDQINTNNPTLAIPLTLSNVTVGTPIVNADTDKATYNTAVQIVPIQGQGYTKPFVYKYNRIALETLFTVSKRTYDVGTAVTVADLLPVFNAALEVAFVAPVAANPATGTLAVTGDLVNNNLPQPTAQSPSLNLILTAQEISLLYVGTVLLSVTSTAVDLTAAITVPSTGLVYTPPA